jgi:hypothetical protein
MCPQSEHKMKQKWHQSWEAKIFKTMCIDWKQSILIQKMYHKHKSKIFHEQTRIEYIENMCK